MPINTPLLKINQQGTCTGLNLLNICDWAKRVIPYHSQFYPIRIIQSETKRAYFHELKEQSRGVDPFTWLFDLVRGLEYLKIITDIIILRDQTTHFCNLHQHQPGENCPNRSGIIFPEPPRNQPIEL